MTAQIGDKYIFEGGEYEYVAKSDYFPFSPSVYGIHPMPASSACWRGYFCTYKINSEGIFLKDLYVNVRSEKTPEINGVGPTRKESADGEEEGLFTYMGMCQYKDVGIKIDYSGKILVGGDFMVGYYVHMGYQLPWSYKVLKELVFEGGELVSVNDISDIAEALRNKMRELEDEGIYGEAEAAKALGLELWWLEDDELL